MSSSLDQLTKVFSKINLSVIKISQLETIVNAIPATLAKLAVLYNKLIDLINEKFNLKLPRITDTTFENFDFKTFFGSEKYGIYQPIILIILILVIINIFNRLSTTVEKYVLLYVLGMYFFNRLYNKSKPGVNKELLLMFSFIVSLRQSGILDFIPIPFISANTICTFFSIITMLLIGSFPEDKDITDIYDYLKEMFKTQETISSTSNKIQ